MLPLLNPGASVVLAGSTAASVGTPAGQEQALLDAQAASTAMGRI